MNLRIDELKARIRQLDELAAAGTLSAAQASASRAPLEKELLSMVMGDGETAAPAAARVSRVLLAAVAGFVVVVAAAGYAWYGTPSAWRGVPVAGSEGEAGQANAMAQVETMVAQLEQRLKERPDDAEGWSMLGRSHSAMGRYPEAVRAFQRVIDLKPQGAQGYADLADAKAMAAGRQLAGEPAALIAKALELDPKNLKALALAGTIAFDANEFDKAARLWEAAVAVAEPGSELARNLQGGVAEARARAAQPAGSAAAPAAANATVSGEVRLAAALAGRASPQDTLFVFARAVEGPRAPLAILRKQVKDLPVNFTLDDSMAMSPAMRLSGFQQVIVGARISKSGNAMPQPGDLQGFSQPVAVGASGVKIEIGEELK
jgi:cytochrome c-type biogenesis protein CcmH